MATVMRLRLLIPAAIAAFATYTLLVRGRETDGLGLETDGWDPLQPYRETPASSRATPPAAASGPVTHPVPTEPPAAEPLPGPVADSPVRGPDAEFLDMFPRAEGSGPSVYDYLAGDIPAPAVPTAAEQVRDAKPPVAEPVETPELSAPPTEHPPSVQQHLPHPWPSEVIDETPAEDDDAHAAAPAAEAASWASGVDEAPEAPLVVTHGVSSLDEGRFALGGWAAASGHSTVSSVTFRRRLAAPVRADQIELSVDAAENVPDGGITVLSDPGFAPDREGFTLLLTAADPGSFSAAGSYRVMPDSAA